MSFAHTRGPTVPYRQRLDELSRLLAQQGSLGLLMIDVSPLTRLERGYGPEAFPSVLGAASHIILELAGTEVRGNDMLTLSDRDADAFLLFLTPGRHGRGPRIHELKAMAERVEGQLNHRLAGLASPGPAIGRAVVVGFGLVLANALVMPERLLARLVEEARDCIRVRKLQRELQNRFRLLEILLEDQLTTVFQPVVDLKCSTVLGYEALSRGPQGTPYESPVSLFDRAAESDMVFELDRTCRNHALGAARGLPTGAKLFVNIVPFSLYDPDFQGDTLLRSLGELGLTPDRVVLEITENYAIENYPMFIEAIEKLTLLGLSVAVDDIGAGYSGFEKIARLNPRYLKFDMQLVRDIDVSYVRREMARALKAFADKMGSTIIAEGIEQENERRALIDLGIEYGQGFLLGRPASDFEAPASAFSPVEGRPAAAAS